MMLTLKQHREAVYNYHHNDIFDHVLLDERIGEVITTVVRYDEDTVLVQKIAQGDLDIKKYPKNDFLRMFTH